MLEGVRLVQDALANTVHLSLVLYVPEQLQETSLGRELLTQVEQLDYAFAATAQVVAAATDTVQPQGIVALAEWPTPNSRFSGLFLVLDALQDPGNVGTLLRTAEATGFTHVLSAQGTVDVYSPKVVRAAMGAHFQLTIEQDLGWETVTERLQNVDHVYAADVTARLPYYAANWRQPSALIVGNEAHGLSDAVQNIATTFMSIPMIGKAESLNAAVAGSVIMFEALRQRSLGRS